MSTIKVDNIAKGANSTDMDNAIFGSARAWVNLDGTGTISIRESYNVSSLTDNGTGSYAVNFTNNLSANHSATGTCIDPTGLGGNHGVNIVSIGAASSSFECIRGAANTLDDVSILCVVFHGS